MADSDINAKGIPIDVDASDITQALVGLWDSLILEGNHEPYSIPLLGTGKARVKDASREEVVKEIILSFIAASRNHKITESLTICIHPKDYQKVDWDRLCEFLKYESQYANLKPLTSDPKGNEESSSSVIRLSDGVIEDVNDYDLVTSSKDNEADICLTEKEQMIVSILNGNEMSRADIAEAMGLSMGTASKLLNKLASQGVIRVKGSNKHRVFYIHIEK